MLAKRFLPLETASDRGLNLPFVTAVDWACSQLGYVKHETSIVSSSNVAPDADRTSRGSMACLLDCAGIVEGAVSPGFPAANLLFPEGRSAMGET